MQAHQFAAFAKNMDMAVSCDADGRPFADSAAATCIVFDSIAEAQAFCQAAAAKTPAVRFEIFDAAGRARPPLLTIVDPSRVTTLETDPRMLHRRRIIAWSLIAGSVPVLLLAYSLKDGGHQIFAGLVGINMLIAALRILWFNLGVRETERAREARLAAASRGEKHER